VAGQVIRWTVPTSLPCYGDWNFRIYPGTFDLFLEPLLLSLRGFVSWRREYYTRNAKNPDGYQSYIDHIAAVNWLEGAAKGADLIVWDGDPSLIWHLAGALVYNGQWVQVRCPGCKAEYRPGSGRIVEWRFGSGLAAEGGHRYVCPEGHTLYAITEWNS
jgi:hypothetical protein